MILQDRIAPEQWAAAARPLPGIAPVETPQWLRVDGAHAEQTRLKADLIETRRGDVIGLVPGAEAAVGECFDHVLAQVSDLPGFSRAGSSLRRPDGAVVTCDRTRPFETLAALVQEDLCILQEHGDVHVLMAALLCFPASWTLAEKLGRPLVAIHAPVPSYDGDVARRVQRLFDGVQPERPLWRANLLRYEDPALYQPRQEADPRREDGVGEGGYWRSERQTILRLPQTRAVVFAIHTTVVEAASEVE